MRVKTERVRASCLESPVTYRGLRPAGVRVTTSRMTGLCGRRKLRWDRVRTVDGSRET
jgi:hypothetical protein